jgi:hypothetical protein
MAGVTDTDERPPGASLVELLSKLALGILLIIFGPVMCLVFAGLPAAGVVHFVLKPTGVFDSWSAMALAADPGPAPSLVSALAANAFVGVALGLVLSIPSLLRFRENWLSALTFRPAIAVLAGVALAFIGVSLPSPWAPVMHLGLREYILAAEGGVWPPTADMMAGFAIALWSGAILICVVAGALCGGIFWLANFGRAQVEDAFGAGIAHGLVAGIAYALILLVGVAIYGIA